MSKYKIAILPGDGIGKDVVDATIKVLDAVGFSDKAEYVWGDIGWEFWINEGNALPDRTIELLKGTTCALFGAITSKPKEEAAMELSPEMPRFAYVYAIGLHSLKKTHEAIKVLENTIERHPYNRDVLFTLATMNRDIGQYEKSLEYATKLVEYFPEDVNYRQFEKQLRSFIEQDF